MTVVEAEARETTEEAEKPVVYLNQKDILPWDQPPKEGYMTSPWLEHADGKTEIVESLGIRTLDVAVGKYRIIGSAAPYLAMVSHLGNGFLDSRKESPSNPPVEEMLFSGGVHIYKGGTISGTELSGLELEESGRIWLGIPLVQIIDKGSPNLLGEAILGEDPTIETVEAILQGYENQRRKKSEARSSARHEQWKEGVRSGQWFDRHGYPPFGSIL
jgi:hypothetical protein